MLTRMVLFLMTLASLLSAADMNKITFAPGDRAIDLAYKLTGNPNDFKCAGYFRNGQDLHLTDAAQCKVTQEQLDKFTTVLPGTIMVMPPARVNTDAVAMNHETLHAKCAELELGDNACKKLSVSNRLKLGKLFSGEIHVPTVLLASKKDTQAPTTPMVHAYVVHSHITLEWEASNDPTTPGQKTSGVAGYTVFRNGQKIDTVNSPGYNDLTAVAGTKYIYTVSAFDAAGNKSSPSPPVAIIIPPPSPPYDTQGIYLLLILGTLGALLFLLLDSRNVYKKNRGEVSFSRILADYFRERRELLADEIRYKYIKTSARIGRALYRLRSKRKGKAKPPREPDENFSLVQPTTEDQDELGNVADELLAMCARMIKPSSQWQDHFDSERDINAQGQLELFVSPIQGDFPDLNGNLGGVEYVEQTLTASYPGISIAHLSGPTQKTIGKRFSRRQISGVTFQIGKKGEQLWNQN